MPLPKTNICDAPGSLLTETLAAVRKEVKERGGLAVSERTGVPFYWLKKFTSGQIPNPSVNRVQYLYQKLTGKAVK